MNSIMIVPNKNTTFSITEFGDLLLEEDLVKDRAKGIPNIFS